MIQRPPEAIARLIGDDLAVERLQTFEALLRRWSSVKNLVSKRDVSEIWTRHILDSVQVQRAVPSARIWVDLGSGGGFPGIVTATLLANDPGAHVHLIDSDNRKCAFLRAVSRETGLRVTVHHARIEDVVRDLTGIDAVSARALADLGQLIAWSSPLLEKGAHGVFLKGKSLKRELTGITSNSNFAVDVRSSLSDPNGALVLVRKNSPDGASGDKS